jgi:hypothetical protein
MRHLILAGVLTALVGAITADAAAQAKPTSLGSVTISQKVMADGKPLAPGTYQIRLTEETPKPGVGQSPEGERYVEFVRGGKVVAREVATVVSNADIGTISEGKKVAPGSTRVELLKGNDFVRIWINRGGNNYLIHLPAQA